MRWSYEDVQALPEDVYDVVVEMVDAELRARERAASRT